MKKRICFALISIGAAAGVHLFAGKLPEVWDGGRTTHIGGFHENEIHDAYQLLGLHRATIPRPANLLGLLGKSDQLTVNDVAWP